MYITKKEMLAISDASDFIMTHADGAEDYSPFEEMQSHLNAVFKKAKKEIEKRQLKALKNARATVKIKQK